MAEIRPEREPQRFDWQLLLVATLIAAVVAALINAVIFLVARGPDTIPEEILISRPTGDEPLGLIPVIFASVVGVLGAEVAFALCAKFPARPVRPFQIISVVVLLLSFGSPFTIPDAPARMIVTLIIMHLVVWTAAITVLPLRAGYRT